MVKDSLTAASFRREVIGDDSLRFRVGLALHGFRINVRSNSRELMERLAYYYKDRITGGALFDLRIDVMDGSSPTPGCTFQPVLPPPGKRPKEEVCDLADGRFVRKVRTGMLFVIADDFSLACGPALINEAQVVNFINARFMAWLANQGYVVFHAAGVSIGQRGLTLAGRSGMGKSSLALHLVSKGANFVSNDRLMLRTIGPHSEMVGIPKMPRINPGTLVSNPDLHILASSSRRAAYLALPTQDLWDMEEKYDAMIDECFGPGRITPCARSTGLVILNWQRNDEPLQIERFDLAERKDLLPMFQKELGPLAGVQSEQTTLAAPQFEDYRRALGDCPLFEVQGGVDFDGAAEVLLSFLTSGAMPAGQFS